MHLPTEEEKDKYYTLLEKTYDACPNYDFKIVLGDMNAQIGREGINYPTASKYRLHPHSNENGMRLLDFATSRGMIIGSTHFPHKEIHKGTWKSPDGQTINQIDHVLIESRHKSMLMDCRTYRGANIDSDHFLVIANIRAKISSNKGRENNNNSRGLRKYKLEELKEHDKRREYGNIGGKCSCEI